MIELIGNNWPAFAGLLGLCIGSFLNVVIHRLPKMMEREWHAAMLRTSWKRIRKRSSTESVATSLTLPGLRTSNFGTRKHTGHQLSVSTWTMLSMR
jgi:prepilin signal peptidase PulO-like enzyme (type II secretory pathway)